MKNRILLLCFIILASASLVFAGPFSDVPKNHWAFDAIETLFDKGIFEGYPDGTFKGNKVVSRFHLAMITAKMLASVEQKPERISKSDLKVIERLTMEFADELEMMNIKVKSLKSDLEGVQKEVSGIRKDIRSIQEFIKNGGNDNVKISGEVVIRNFGYEKKNVYHNHRTESMFKVHLDTKISDKISAHASWNLIEDVNNPGVRGPNEWNGRNKNTGDVEIAHFKFKDVFKKNDILKVGRDWYSHGHGLIIHDYMDAISYTQQKKSGKLAFNFFFDRNKSFTRTKDYYNIWNINYDYYYNNHKLYLGFYYNSRDSIYNYDRTTPGLSTFGKVNKNKNDIKIELGASGPIGNKNSKLTYDLAGVHNLSKDFIRYTDNNRISDLKGWLGYGAVKYDTKKDFSFKLAYTYADEESHAEIKREDFNSSYMRAETPYEDLFMLISNGLTVSNLKDAKAQIAYRFKNADKHSLRLAYDKIESKNKRAPNSTDTSLITFEYRYKLSKNTRIRFVYQNAKDKEGQYTLPNSRLSLYMTEIYARF